MPLSALLYLFAFAAANEILHVNAGIVKPRAATTANPSIQPALSSLTLVDSPHVPLANPNSTLADPWQWWYFDAISTTTKASLQVVFYSAFGFGPLFSPLATPPFLAQISGTFPNGTKMVDDFAGAAIGTVTQSRGSPLVGTNGNWPGTGSWTSRRTPFPTYEVNFGFTGIKGGVYSGQLILKSQAVARYPCLDPTPPDVTADKNLLGPSVGWSNAIPGAHASATFTVNGEAFTISGNGYHDSNFGNEILHFTVSTWYWGRAVIGPYTLVYFFYLPKGLSANGTPPTSEWYTSGSLDYNGIPLFTGCSAEGQINGANPSLHETMTIQLQGDIWSSGPSGVGTAKDGDPQGVTITYKTEFGSWTFDLTSQNVVISSKVIHYSRWTATGSGGAAGETFTGKGMFELLNQGG